jgi:transposase
MNKIYRVDLTEEERATLDTLTRQGAARARQIRRAQILLLADAGQRDTEIAKGLRVGVSTVERTRKRFVEEGLTAALSERPRPGGTPKLDGKQEALLVALACSNPPEGRKCWSMQLLADRLVGLGVVAAISDETVRRLLKKGTSSPGLPAPGASPR